MENPKASNSITIDELIESIQTQFEINGSFSPDDGARTKMLVALVALDAIEFAVKTTIEYYDEFSPVAFPECEHRNLDVRAIADDDDCEFID